jgi:hypothetical protein
VKKPTAMGQSFARFRDRQIDSIERRLFLRQGLSLGALSLLAGCSISDQETVEKVLQAMSGWNDRVQGWLFDPRRLAQEYPESAITRPFPSMRFTARTRCRKSMPAIIASNWRA